MQITRGKILGAQKIVIYGPEGIGKSTLAAQFPDPLFIDTEGSTKHMDVARTPKPSSWTMLQQQVDYVRQNPDICQTLVIDTADWAEQLCVNYLVSMAPNAKEHGLGGIEGFGYGKGYTYLAEEFGRLLNLLEDVIQVKVHVVVNAHSHMRKFEQPDEIGNYDRWELKLQKKTAPLLKEWADMVLFANYKTFVVNVDGKGAEKGKNKAQGGRRVMYTSHHPCWDAKNRHGLPSEIPMEYKEIAHCILARDKATAQPVQELPKIEQPQVSVPDKPIDPKQAPKLPPAKDDLESQGVPKALADLMRDDGVSLSELQAAVESRKPRVVPVGTPFRNYPKEYVEGVLIAAWGQVYGVIEAMREDDIPF